jgi:hypothetical protein
MSTLTRHIGRVGLACLSTILLAYPALAADAPEGEPLAWIRFVQGDHLETYEGTPYLWLGRVAMTLTIDVKPEPGHALDFLWGSKNDTRAAVATINGKDVALTHGGYNGFQWLRVPIPDGVAGTQYQIAFKAADPKPAFFSAVQLTKVGGAPAPGIDMTPAVHGIAIEVTSSGWSAPPTGGEAFPEMRPLWDTPVELRQLGDAAERAAFVEAEKNSRQAAESLFRCRKFVDGWLAQADETTGLIPRNLTRNSDIWNAKDSAADNYPFMVLTTALTDRSLFEGRMRDMLRTETRLTSRVDSLPDTWSFTKQAFEDDEINLDSILFGASEYCKDGLMPLTEWLGASPWSERMVGMIDDIFAHANVDTPYGKIPTSNIEVHGELLQVLSRLFWMTGDDKYLDWALRLGDYYLLGGHHPTDDLDKLRLMDHGCEITDGLAELYVTLHFAKPAKKQQYREPIHRMYDRILEIGRDPLGMMYATIEPKTGNHDDRIADTWGYNYYGIYSVYLVDNTEPYGEAVRHVMTSLDQMADHNWGGSDAYADSIEGAINLYAREPCPQGAEYIDAQIPLMWSAQKPDGVVEGWHGDGNSARTAIMYALWKTQGTWVEPWRSDLRLGASRRNGATCILLAADEPWQGRLRFDIPRHRESLHLPIDYARINQFPEWLTVEADTAYTVRYPGKADDQTRSGQELREGLRVELTGENKVALIVVEDSR